MAKHEKKPAARPLVGLGLSRPRPLACPFALGADEVFALAKDGDLDSLQGMNRAQWSYHARIQSIDELLERDKQREKDGFPRKIRVGRLIKPGKSGKEKIVVVPTTVEEKFIHDKIRSAEEEQAGDSGGSGEGEEGEVIGEEPVHGDSPAGGPGGEGGGPHEMESSAYDLGRILTEQFELPNLQDKGKKRSLTNYTYDLTDRNRGSGQVLDKKATLRRIVRTNIALGRLPDPNDIDTTGFLISPDDMVYRVLSREIDYESQAMVFFLRDYSGSMSGKPTDLVVSQHVLIYSWLLYQYAKQVETRFILHDTEAKEVPDFFTYYNSAVAGGTKVVSAYRLVNEIVKNENLEPDYNIYVFHGTDGDDWDTEGKETVPELTKMLKFSNRVGVTIAGSSRIAAGRTNLELVLNRSKLLKDSPDQLRMDVIKEDADEARLIEGIKKLISE
ncbi:DUF444 family protein [Dethiosulfatarculus sandiegensis]|uniref:Stress response protein n=1 Tax=Dethiosulfatarculus sandiegensis TaxID=1429043 RepID=A0A0D2JCR2_9BACT|nr:DUF444 family protein [Dethiosulfatarculus sandiegensis]KIX15934.1 hypothetical protein X474_01400 [Dethiosulfatarculus sandiegensis]